MNIKKQLFPYISKHGDLSFIINGENKLLFKFSDTSSVNSLGAVLTGAHGCIEPPLFNEEKNATALDKLLAIAEELIVENVNPSEDYASKFNNEDLINAIVESVGTMREKKISSSTIKLGEDNDTFLYMEIDLLTNKYVHQCYVNNKEIILYTVSEIDENNNISVKEGPGMKLKPKVDFNYTYYVNKQNKEIEVGDIIYIQQEGANKVLVISSATPYLSVNR